MAKLYFYFSAMNAGKSTTLLQSSHNYNERQMDTLLFTPAIDHRHGVGVISTRIGLSARATPIHPDTALFESIQLSAQKNTNIRCVLVDEAQFLSKTQVKDLGKVADQLDLPVLTYGIRTDFQGEPFEGSQYLLAWADSLIEIKTICHCGKKASMNLRLDAHGKPTQQGEKIQIGGNAEYSPTCRYHFYHPQQT